MRRLDESAGFGPAVPGGASMDSVFDSASHSARSWKAIVPPPRFSCETIRLMSPTQTQSESVVMPHLA